MTASFPDCLLRLSCRPSPLSRRRRAVAAARGTATFVSWFRPARGLRRRDGRAVRRFRRETGALVICRAAGTPVATIAGHARWDRAGRAGARGVWPRAAATISRPRQSPSTSNPPPDPDDGALCASGQICTLAGTGVPGDGADGLPARETRLYLPQDTTVGPGRARLRRRLEQPPHPRDRRRRAHAHRRGRRRARHRRRRSVDRPAQSPDQRDLRSARLARRDVDRRLAQQPRQEGRPRQRIDHRHVRHRQARVRGQRRSGRRRAAGPAGRDRVRRAPEIF